MVGKRLVTAGKAVFVYRKNDYFSGDNDVML